MRSSVLAIVLIMIVAVAAGSYYYQQSFPPQFSLAIAAESRSTITIYLSPAKGEYLVNEHVTVTGRLLCSGVCPLALTPYPDMTVQLASSWGWKNTVKTDVSGGYSSSLSLPGSTGAYWIKATFEGFSEVALGSSATVSFSVVDPTENGISRSTTAITIRLVPQEATYAPNERVIVTGTLSCSGSCPLALVPYGNEVVQLSASWLWFGTAMTDSAGHYSASINVPSQAGNHWIEAKFQGSTNAQPSSVSVSFAVKSTQTTATQTSYTRTSSQGAKQVTLSLIDAPNTVEIGEELHLSAKLGGNGAPIANALLSFVILNVGKEITGDELYSGSNFKLAETKTDGIANAVLTPQLDVGQAVITVTFVGDRSWVTARVDKTVEAVKGVRIATTLALEIMVQEGQKKTSAIFTGSKDFSQEFVAPSDKISVGALIWDERLNTIQGQVCYEGQTFQASCFRTPNYGTLLARTTAVVGAFKIAFRYDGDEEYAPSHISFNLKIQALHITESTEMATFSPFVMSSTTNTCGGCASIELTGFSWTHKDIQVQVQTDTELSDDSGSLTALVQRATARWSVAMNSFGAKYNAPEITGWTFQVTPYDSQKPADIVVSFTNRYICGSFYADCAGVAIVSQWGDVTGLGSYIIKINVSKYATQKVLEDVMTHEFGHALGIGHVNNVAGNYDLMGRYVKNTMKITTLDLYGLAAIYQGETAIAVSLPTGIPYGAVE